MNENSPKDGKIYWRSIERLLESPVLGSSPSDEFPGGASYPPDSVDRRSMLKLMGASFALAGLASCRRPDEKIVPYVNAPEGIIPGIPKYYATLMPFGAEALGIVAESHEGRPTKIEGNSLHPETEGASSLWMQAALLELYDPDRSQRPSLRNAEGRHEAATWAAFEAKWAELAAQGGGIELLSGTHCSPTEARLIARFRERFPAAGVTFFEPLNDIGVLEAISLVTGQGLRPVYHFDRASTIVSLDCDFLLTETRAVAHTRDFANSRRVDDPSSQMSRLYVAESTMSLTGANADHRVRLRSGQVGAFGLALADALTRLGVAVPAGPGTPPVLPDGLREWAQKIAQDLQNSGGRSLVVAGRRQPAAVHAIALAINAALGAIGQTVSLYPLGELSTGGAPQLAGLAERIRAGSVKTLLILGSNPALAAPADLDFGNLLSSVETSIALSPRLDETAALCNWHLPECHFLESWGDGRSADGTTGIVQPLISPLFDSRSRLEILGLLAGSESTKGYDLVRETWRGLLGEADFERKWTRVLHDGVLAGTSAPVTDLSVDLSKVSTEDLTADPGETIELVLTPSNTIYDGRFANNSWLQELPDPLSKICWDNAALVSPATAAGLGLSSGEVIAIRAGEMALEAPVWVMPGLADNSISLSLGYGRTAAGAVGNGVGVDGYRLASVDSPFLKRSIEISKTGRRHSPAQTQEHWEMHGRPLIREANLSEWRENPEFAREPDAGLRLESLWHEHDYGQGYQWGMAIDLNSCTGCGACVVACQSENNIPVVGREQVARGREMHWLRIDRYFSGNLDNPEVGFQPVPCMHCENAPCEQVCPVAATVHDREGLNAMVYNRCIGTRYCSNNCPYKVRRFNFFNYTKDTPELVQLGMNPDVTVRSRGVMEKCTYCVQRISETKIKAKAQGRLVRDGEIQTACQQTCPARAITFGNITDADSQVARVKGSARNYVILAELNNKPRTSYLAKLRNPSSEA